MVGVGRSENNKWTEVEIVDLESSATNCLSLEDFPKPRYGAIGGLDFNDNPLICGGLESNDIKDSKQDCFSWRDSAWQVFSPLTEQRYYSAWYPSPFPKESHKLLVAGGDGGSGVIF